MLIGIKPQLTLSWYTFQQSAPVHTIVFAHGQEAVVYGHQAWTVNAVTFLFCALHVLPNQVKHHYMQYHRHPCTLEHPAWIQTANAHPLRPI